MAHPAVSAPTWFVKIGSEVFGPYPSAHLAAYISEGRLQARTMIAEGAHGPFRALADHPAWADNFVTAVLRPVTDPYVDPEDAAPAPAARPAPAQLRPVSPAPEPAPLVEAAGENAQFFVLCEGGGEGVAAVAAALSGLGATAPATSSSWFLTARTTADSLRNALTRHAPPSAKLVILDLSRNDAAWFNLGANRDAAIRRLRPAPAHPPRG